MQKKEPKFMKGLKEKEPKFIKKMEKKEMKAPAKKMPMPDKKEKKRK